MKDELKSKSLSEEPCPRREWQTPEITRMGLNKTASGNTFRADEEGFISFLICDTNDPTCDPIFGS
jgi:hypothetical protein